MKPVSFETAAVIKRPKALGWDSDGPMCGLDKILRRTKR